MSRGNAVDWHLAFSVIFYFIFAKWTDQGLKRDEPEESFRDALEFPDKEIIP